MPEILTTSFEVIIDKFLKRIEKDRDFFTYYNISLEEALELALEQSKNYLIEAVDMLTDRCVPDVDFYDYTIDKDEDGNDIMQFNFELTKKEQSLIAELMREVYFVRDFSLLKAFKIAMTPTDLNQFSPANERATYLSLVKTIEAENRDRISKYISCDRLTGQPKFIKYSLGGGH